METVIVTNPWVEFITNPAVIGVIVTLLSGVLTVIGTIIGKWIQQKWGEMTWNKCVNMAEKVVKFVDQVYKAYTGDEKYQKAIERLKALAKSQGISYTDEQWEVLIESAVHDLKMAWEYIKDNTNYEEPVSPRFSDEPTEPINETPTDIQY